MGIKITGTGIISDSDQLLIGNSTTTDFIYTDFTNKILDIDGNITATSLSGDGSALSNLPSFSPAELTNAIGNINNPLLDLPLNNNLTMKQGSGSLTFSRSTSATYIDRYGVVQTASADEPRFESEGLLLEGASTNLLTYSDITLGDVPTRSVGITTATSFPQFTNGVQFPESATGDYAYKSSSLTIGVFYALSFFVVMDDGSVPIIAQDYGDSIGNFLGVIGGSIVTTGNITLVNASENLYRASFAFLAENATGNVGVVRYSTNSAKGFKVTGYQLEEFPFATSYIPTLDTAVTRNTDVCYVDYLNNFPNYQAINLSILADYNRAGTFTVSGNSQMVFRIDYGEDFWYASNYNGLSSIVFANGASSSLNVAGGNLLVPHKVACRVTDGETQYFLDGLPHGNISGASDHTGSPTRIYIGSYDNIGNHVLFGHIKSFRIYDNALTTTEIRIA